MTDYRTSHKADADAALRELGITNADIEAALEEVFGDSDDEYTWQREPRIAHYVVQDDDRAMVLIARVVFGFSGWIMGMVTMRLPQWLAGW